MLFYQLIKYFLYNQLKVVSLQRNMTTEKDSGTTIRV
jgi:hypothetical protein